MVYINPAYTSQRCSACGHVDRGNRESQAVFHCRACGFECNADVNAARNILIAGLGLLESGRDGTRPGVEGCKTSVVAECHAVGDSGEARSPR